MRLLSLAGVLLVGAFSLGCDPSTVIEAQSLPATIAADLTPPATTSGFLSYKLLLDGTPVGVQSAANCPTPPALCTATFGVATAGAHVLTYVWTSQLLSTDPSSTVDSPASAPTSFTLNAPLPAPTAAAKNVRKGGS